MVGPGWPQVRLIYLAAERVELNYTVVVRNWWVDGRAASCTLMADGVRRRGELSV